jgi:hypothetical protein
VSDDPTTWIIAGVEVAVAVGIAVFWITWFRQPHDEPWLPPGFVDHEAPFVFTDSLLAVILVVAAALQVAEEPAGRSLGLVAAGMLAFLGVLDFAYFARTGLFRRDRGGFGNAFVVAGVLITAVVLVARFF